MNVAEQERLFELVKNPPMGSKIKAAKDFGVDLTLNLRSLRLSPTAVAQGSSQVTRDLDICYERSPDNLKRLASALVPYHPRLRGVPDGVPFFWTNALCHKA